MEDFRALIFKVEVLDGYEWVAGENGENSVDSHISSPFHKGSWGGCYQADIKLGPASRDLEV